MPSGHHIKKYKGEYHDQLAFRYSLLGYSKREVAECLGVTHTTINNWCKAYPSFAAAYDAGRSNADAEVAAALYKKATGFTVRETHVSNYQGEITLTPVEKHFAPDTVAAKYWLGNRQPDKWREKQEVSLSGDGVCFNLDFSGKGQDKTPEDDDFLD